MFQAYKVLLEKQYHKIIEVLCINNGGGSILPLHLNHFVLLKGYCTNLNNTIHA
jgi:hypothetical protein